MTRRLLPALVGCSAALVLLGAGYWFGRSSSRGPRFDSAPVVEAIRKVSRLATIEMEIADVVKVEEVRTIVGVFDVPKNATLRLRGKVQGGFDLMAGLKVTADEGTRTLRIHLPAPQIVSVDARIEWFDERSGWLNPITPEDRTRWTAWARTSLARAARDAGINARATDHARELLTETARAFGWKADVSFGREPSL